VEGKIEKFVKKVDSVSIWTGKVASFLIIPITLLEGREVIYRYAFDKPTIWSWELCTMLFAALFLFGGAWVLQENKHIATDIIYVRFSPKVQAYIDLVTYFCFFCVFVSVMLWQGSIMALDSIKIQETSYTLWAPPIYPSKTMMVFAFALLTLQGIAKIIRDFIFVSTGRKI
jgi:TRAP-type mannitol/chloroaromatic compound transport system permease small subunit